MKKNKIGIGLITCDRPEFYKESMASVAKAVEHLGIEHILINDGEELPYYPRNYIQTPRNYIQTNKKIGVGKAKNCALKFLMRVGCEHIFLMEDDIVITDDAVFQKYIDAYKSTGIKHFNFALHGNHNLRYDNREPAIKKSIKYPDDTVINLYPELLGAFSYYHQSVIQGIGLMDENFYNALEHVDHTYQAYLKGYTSPFRWFCDIADSELYLKDIKPDHQNSVIRDETFMRNFQKALDFFIKKNDFSVVIGYGPPETFISEKECLDFLKNIYNNRET